MGGFETEAVTAKPLAGPANPGDDFIGNEIHARLPQHLRDGREVACGWQLEASGKAHRFREEGSYAVGGFALDKAREFLREAL
jgi:hypothetical protein